MDFPELLASMMSEEEPETKKDEVDEVDDEYEDQAVAIFANAIAAAMSEIEERLGLENQVNSLNSAMKFVTRYINILRVSRRDALLKSLRRYERLGHDRFRRDYRRKLAKGYERNEDAS